MSAAATSGLLYHDLAQRMWQLIPRFDEALHHISRGVPGAHRLVGGWMEMQDQ
jgi:hypothetical protein